MQSVPRAGRCQFKNDYNKSDHEDGFCDFAFLISHLWRALSLWFSTALTGQTDSMRGFKREKTKTGGGKKNKKSQRTARRSQKKKKKERQEGLLLTVVLLKSPRWPAVAGPESGRWFKPRSWVRILGRRWTLGVWAFERMHASPVEGTGWTDLYGR